MSYGSKITLVALSALLVTIAVAAGGATFWLKGRLQTTEYCANCHVVAPYYDTWKSSVFTAHSHAKLGLVCQDCHTRTVRDGLREWVNAATKSYQLPLQDHTITRETCFRCHVSDEILAARTRNLTGPDGFPLGRNPHDSHWGPLECGTCHKMHEASQDFCAECHRLPATGPEWETARSAGTAERFLIHPHDTERAKHFLTALEELPR